jgi:hypothetical protein
MFQKTQLYMSIVERTANPTYLWDNRSPPPQRIPAAPSPVTLVFAGKLHQRRLPMTHGAANVAEQKFPSRV